MKNYYSIEDTTKGSSRREMTRNIVIKNLDDQEAELIEKIKLITGEKTASKAIFKALGSYLYNSYMLSEHRKHISNLRSNLEKLEHWEAL